MPMHEMDLSARVLAAWTMAASIGPSADLKNVPLEGLPREVGAMVTREGFRGIFIPLASGESVDIPASMKSQATGALRADTAQFSDSRGAVKALSVWCRDPSCDGAFMAFVGDFLGKVSDGSLGDLLEECHREFRRLIGELTPGAGGRITGLLGELLVLRDLVRIEPGAIRFWGGPRFERHDFRNGPVGIEVKASLRSESKSDKVHISDWDQLDVPEGGLLYLHVIRLERVAGGQFSINELIGEICGRLDVPACEAFRKSMDNFSLTDLLSNDRFSIQSRHTYEVRADFPRLLKRFVPTESRSGISMVSYDLDLSQASDFIIPDDACIKAICGVNDP